MARDSLSLRVVSAAIMIPAGLSVVWFGGIPLTMASAIVGVLMWFEYWSVTTKIAPSRHYGWFATSAILIASVLLLRTTLRADVGMAALAVAAGTIVAFSGTGRPFILVCGFVVIAGAIASLNIIRAHEHSGFLLTLSIMLFVWATDIAAYFAGKGFGGPRLAPTGSPNKTWSGAVGAVFCSGLIGAFVAGLLGSPAWRWIAFAVLLSLIAQSGDWLQSKWKRAYGVKDSGSLIPGHGGFLDRLDSFSAVLVVTGAVLTVWPDFPSAFLRMDTL